MANKLDPREELDTSYRWNIALWLAKQEFGNLYEDLLHVRKLGARIVRDNSKKSGFRIAPPKDDNKEQKKLFLSFLRERFKGDFNKLNIVLDGINKMKNGNDYKYEVDSESIEAMCE